MNKFLYSTDNKPVLALAPMDGFTDCAFREIVKKYGKPDLVFTEFVNCQGLIRATDKLINILRYTEFQRPIIAQLFGRDPDYFYKASLIICKLGFDGVDINMGCPAKNIASKGGGAGLIRKPELAVKIINAVKKARRDYQNDQLCPVLVQGLIDRRVREWGVKIKKDRKITVSVKTRTGYNEDIVEEWIRVLSQAEPDFITLHARTFKQKFKGKADWGTIRRAVSVTKIPIVGNGDVKSCADIQKMLKQTECQGVMIGRAAIGKLWIFSKDHKPAIDRLKNVALEHAKLYFKYKGERKFYEMRKHLVAYFKGFKGAKELRRKVSVVEDLEELEDILG